MKVNIEKYLESFAPLVWIDGGKEIPIICVSMSAILSVAIFGRIHYLLMLCLITSLYFILKCILSMIAIKRKWKRAPRSHIHLFAFFIVFNVLYVALLLILGRINVIIE